MEKDLEKYFKEVEIPLKSIFTDMFKYAPSKLFAILGNAIIVPIYTNLLSPSQYGLYAMSLAVLSFLCILFSDWVGLSALRFFRKNQLIDEMPKYFSTLLFLLFTNLFVMWIFVYFSKNVLTNYFNISLQILLIVLLLIFPVSIRALLFQLLRAQIKPGSYTFSTILNQVMTILIAILFLKYTDLQAISILIAMAISITVIDVILFFQGKIFDYLKFIKPDFKTMKTLIGYGSPLAFASLGLWLINQSNKFIATGHYGLEGAGLVSVAYNITFPIFMALFAIITIASYPRIINMYEEKVDVRPLISKLSGYYLLLALPLVVFVSVYSSDIITLFANSKFQEAYILLPFFAFSALFLSFADYTTIQYHLAQKTQILTWMKLISGILCFVLNCFLIQKMGLIGVGFATLLSNIFYFIATLCVRLPNLEFRLPQKEFFVVSISFVPVILFYFLLQMLTVDIILEMSLVFASYYIFYYGISKLFSVKY